MIDEEFGPLKVKIIKQMYISDSNTKAVYNEITVTF